MTTGAIPPIGSSDVYSGMETIGEHDQERRRQERRRGARSRALVATGEGDDPAGSTASAKPAAPLTPPPAAFAAQVLGQPGRKRGLRGGPEVLDTARSTYLSREYSGDKDRRPSPGIRKQTEI